MAQTLSNTVAFVTRGAQWLERRLDEGGWVRRAILAFATYATWETTRWCFAYAEQAAIAGRPGLDTAAVIGAVSAVPGGFATFVFKWYLESRAPVEARAPVTV